MKYILNDFFLLCKRDDIYLFKCENWKKFKINEYMEDAAVHLIYWSWDDK